MTPKERILLRLQTAVDLLWHSANDMKNEAGRGFDQDDYIATVETKERIEKQIAELKVRA